MIIHMLWGQRLCRYPGEYAPELLAAIDEHGIEENQEYLEQETAKYLESGEFNALSIVQGVISDYAIKQILHPDPLQVKIVAK